LAGTPITATGTAAGIGTNSRIIGASWLTELVYAPSALKEESKQRKGNAKRTQLESKSIGGNTSSLHQIVA